MVSKKKSSKKSSSKKSAKKSVKKSAKKSAKKSSKKSAKKSTKKSSKKKPSSKKKSNIKKIVSKQEPVETVRVKTFIMEKPVYVEAPIGKKEIPARARHPESFEMFDPSESRYSKEDSSQELSEGYETDSSEDSFGDFPEDGSDFEEPLTENEEEIESTPSGHLRSRAVFSKVWWKRAFWQSAAIWLAIFIFAFFMDFVNLSNVELQRNWVFLFVSIFVFMLVYQKFLKGKIVI